MGHIWVSQKINGLTRQPVYIFNKQIILFLNVFMYQVLIFNKYYKNIPFIHRPFDCFDIMTRGEWSNVISRNL